MKGAMIIAGKDLRNFFMSPLFYIIAGACNLLWAVLFIFVTGRFIEMSRMGGPAQGGSLHNIIGNHFWLVNLILMFGVSAITMKLFTEEKRQRTFDLLLTSPVTATEITLGKLIAGIATTWAMILISTLMPLSLSFYASLDWGPFASALLGTLLLIGGYVAIGMFASSITDSPVVAVLLALVFNLMLWSVGAFAFGSASPAERAVFEHLSINEHFQIFLNGSFTIAGFVYYLSVIFFFTFLTQRVVESSRWR